jgi:hypothetical protein
MQSLRKKVTGVERTVMADWDTGRLDQEHLRDRLNDIAADVARLVYAGDGRDPVESEESLFERVQRFAEDGIAVDESKARRPPAKSHRAAEEEGRVSEHLGTLRGP